MSEFEYLKQGKTFRYELGHVHFKTATAGEMIEFLKQFPAETPLIAAWEGTAHGFGLAHVVTFDGGHEKDHCFVIEFDVESDLNPNGNSE